MPTVDDCRLLELPRIHDSRGTLSVVEARKHVPFDIERVFFVYDLEPGKTRGAHAHKTLHEVVICVAGGMDLTFDDGTTRKTVRLEKPSQALYLPPMIWAWSGNYTPGTVLLALASHPYDAGDYYRDYDEYLAVMRTLRR